MKLKNYLVGGLFVIFSMGLSSCSSDLDLALSVAEKETATKLGVGEIENISVLEGVNGKVLKFEDLSSYNKNLEIINKMTHSERLEFYESIGFESIEYLLIKADLELDNIFSVGSLEEFNSEYSAFKKKHSDLFLFNSLEKDDRSPYSKIVHLEKEYIENKNGSFYIGDSLVQVEQHKSFVERYKLLTRGSSTEAMPANHAWSHISERKVGVYSTLNEDGAVYMRFTAQKKYIFGWKRYSTMYNLDITLRGGDGTPFEYYKYGVYSSKEGQLLEIRTGELSGNSTMHFGRVGFREVPFNPWYSCTGTMAIWSRGVPYSNKGKARVDMKIGHNVI